jgi:hypothetical protein
VVTVKFKLPGSAALEAGIATVSCPEFTYVAAIFVPFSATVELVVKPVPFSVTVAAVLIGPALGESDVRVGAGGFAIVTVRAFERAGLEYGLFTVMDAVPAAVNKPAGTVAMSDSPP